MTITTPSRLTWKRFRLPERYHGWIYGASCRGHRLHVAKRKNGHWFFTIDNKCPPSRRSGFPDDGTTYRLARIAKDAAETWALGHIKEE